jgi:hypothetical protein
MVGAGLGLLALLDHPAQIGVERLRSRNVERHDGRGEQRNDLVRGTTHCSQNSQQTRESIYPIRQGCYVSDVTKRFVDGPRARKAMTP